MGKKSETLAPQTRDPAATRLSATEASRSFSRLLDDVEAGRRFVVHRRGRDLCTISPALVDGRRASACLEILRSRPPALLDDRFADDLRAILAEEPPEARPSWGS